LKVAEEDQTGYEAKTKENINKPLKMMEEVNHFIYRGLVVGIDINILTMGGRKISHGI
jgi:hypothetical protein